MSAKRTVFKAITYKALTTVFLVTVAYIRTNSVSTALMFGFGDAFCKLLLYSAHEAAWNKLGGS